MGIHVVKVPDVGEGVAEVELVSWAVAVGQSVSRNDVLAEVMTDKANVEIPAPADGVVAILNGEIGSILAVGSSLIELTVEGADMSSAPEVHLPSGDQGADPARSLDVANGTPQPTDVVDASRPSAVRRLPTDVVGPPRPEGEKPRASPAVRSRAREAGIDMRRVPGSGPAGRIINADLDRYLALGQPAARSPGLGRSTRQANLDIDEQAIVGIRRKIAEQMVASTTTIPHITYVEEVDVSALEDLRTTLNDQRRESQTRLTLLPFLVRALVRVLPDFPSMNAHVDDERGVLTTYGGIHVGIATQTANGLIVPVIRHTEAMSIWEIAAALNDQAEVARSGRSAPSDLRGSTITITSLGALGGLVTTPVINKPEVAIIGVNKIATRPVWAETAFVPRQIMNLSSSFDHRVIDGWDAASFVQGLRHYLEQPAMLFIDEP